MATSIVLLHEEHSGIHNQPNYSKINRVICEAAACQLRSRECTQFVYEKILHCNKVKVRVSVTIVVLGAVASCGELLRKMTFHYMDVTNRPSVVTIQQTERMEVLPSDAIKLPRCNSLE